MRKLAPEAVAAACGVVSAYLLHRLISGLLETKKDAKSCPSARNDDKPLVAVDELPPFPWEGKPNSHPRIQQHLKGSQEEQLAFLSTMTFANGGMRAPSCLCCR